MSTANLTALVGALAALVTAIGGVLAVVRHVNGPAHAGTVVTGTSEETQTQPPEAPVTVVRPPSSGLVPPGTPPTVVQSPTNSPPPQGM